MCFSTGCTTTSTCQMPIKTSVTIRKTNKHHRHKTLTIKIMKTTTTIKHLVLVLLFAVLAANVSAVIPAANPPANFKHQYAVVNGVRIHYVIGGKGEPLLLVHGF